MQFTVLINQEKAVEWGLSNSEAILFGFLYSLPSWADAQSIDGTVFYHLSKGKIIEELPILTDKRDTAYRLLKAIEKKGLIHRCMRDGKLYVALAKKAAEWNHSEKNPKVGKKSDLPRKKIRGGSEKNPTYLGNFSDVSDNHDQITSDQKKTPHADTCSACFADIKSAYPKRDGSHRWADAERAWNARLEDGHEPEEILEGVKRYATYCDASDITGTKYVQQAATFLGRNKGFLEDWKAEKPKRGAQSIAGQNYTSTPLDGIEWATP